MQVKSVTTYYWSYTWSLKIHDSIRLLVHDITYGSSIWYGKNKLERDFQISISNFLQKRKLDNGLYDRFG